MKPSLRFQKFRIPAQEKAESFSGLDDSYWVVSSLSEAKRLLSYLMEYEGVSSLDTETRGWDVKDRCSPQGKAFATCVTVATSDYPHIYVDNYGPNEGLIHTLTPWLESSRRKVLHNAKFDMHVLANHGISLGGFHGDTMVMDFLLDTSARGQHDLETVYQRYFGVELPGYQETFKEHLLKKDGTPSKRTKTTPHTEWWDRGEKAKVIKYACKDTRLGLEVFHHHEEALRKIPWVKKDGRTYLDYYNTFELPYTKVLFRMERRGVRVDLEKVKELQAEYSRIERESMEAFFSELAKLGVEESYLEKFNPGSGKQLGHLLFNLLNLPVLKTTPSKTNPQPSTDEETLNALSELKTDVDLTFLKRLLEARKAEKNRGTYADYLLKWAPQYGGKIHTSFNQIGAETARLSSSQPNLQNIPIRTALGKKLREVFVCGESETLIDADYSQIEVRMMAHRSGDPTMKRFVENGGDQHSLTAWTVMEHVGEAATKKRVIEEFGSDPESKRTQPAPEGLKWIKANKPLLRDKGKTMNFAIQYGAGKQRAAAVFGISEEAGEKVIEAYFDTYDGLGAFMDRRRKQAVQFGYIRTMFGRYCHLPHARGRSFGLRKQAERQSVNYDIQGSARDVIMAGMLLLDRDPVLKKLKAKMVLQVHDELLFTVPKKNVEKALTRIKEVMEDPYSPFGFAPMSVKTVAEIGQGPSWGEAH